MFSFSWSRKKTKQQLYYYCQCNYPKQTSQEGPTHSLSSCKMCLYYGFKDEQNLFSPKGEAKVWVDLWGMLTSEEASWLLKEQVCQRSKFSSNGKYVRCMCKWPVSHHCPYILGRDRDHSQLADQSKIIKQNCPAFKCKNLPRKVVQWLALHFSALSVDLASLVTFCTRNMFVCVLHLLVPL